jgi:hypothetical protein
VKENAALPRRSNPGFVDHGMLEVVTEITEPALLDLVELCDLKVFSTG